MSLSAWVGWPGSGPAPGYDWLPGPKLRFVILGLTYAFLALALTVNYAYGTAFFLLALLGMYMGFRRGFVNGFTRTEKLVFLAFAAYPVVAIASYLLGTQTNTGFRFIGRDLRFLLFIPVYLAIRWARPNVRHVGWAFAVGAIADLIMALLQHQPWPALTPHGVAGTHISFGDLSILSGFLAAALLMPPRHGVPEGKILRILSWAGAVIGLLAGVGAGVVASARGGWLAIPVLLLLFLWLPPFGSRFRLFHRLAFSVGGLLLLAAAAWLVPSIHHRINLARQSLAVYITVANARSINAPCVDHRDFLGALLKQSPVRGYGQVKIVRLPPSQRQLVGRFGCRGTYALMLRNPQGSGKSLEILIYRGNRWPARPKQQSATLLARGNGSFNVGWRGAWVQITDPDTWHQYSAIQSYNQTIPVFVRVSPGKRMLVIPLQKPRGIFAYALAESSLAQRLEMWQAAWVLFREHPWLGAGTGAFYPLGEEALGRSAMAPIVGNYQHAHSDYLTSLGTKGIVGFLAFMTLLVASLAAMVRQQKTEQSDAPVLSGTVLAVGFVIFGLTETMFIHSLVNSWYVTVVAVSMALVFGVRIQNASARARQ